jgi:hypothetical protein
MPRRDCDKEHEENISVLFALDQVYRSVEAHRRSTTRTIRLFLYSDSHTAPA